jgi:hypothetical protein
MAALYSSNQSIPQDMLLGNLVFMNLSDMKIPVTQMKDIFQNTGLNAGFIRDISAADAFRRATSSVKGVRKTFVQPTNQSKTVDVKFEVDEVRCDSDSIKRVVGIKAIDDVNEEVAYESVLEIVFNRQTSSVSYLPIVSAAGPNLSTIEQVGQDIVDKFTDWSVYHNKDTVKNIINRIVASTHPVNLMPTGLCKFIPKSNTDTLYNLKSALEQMSDYRIDPNSHPNICEIIPVIDTDDQRALIDANFNAEITDELFKFTQELKDVLQKKSTLSTRSAQSYVDKFKLLQAKTKEYETLLGIYTDAIYAQITDALALVDTGKNDDDVDDNFNCITDTF